ncbi:hypothetical protein [Duganella violaceipulchra]|uniref:Uncharacterized protein n=1 Tax=Duganella violaceipulchra TaxID=2849652 RepID=A0AA41L4A0_9BURK|nr:hypothetical protein [Duganella violaceicalia]MBV6322689.1 hypothetical protein [Duganella violaceicalia]MCP2010903.1 hypothetical protein [Duganella violaceicalia]
MENKFAAPRHGQSGPSSPSRNSPRAAAPSPERIREMLGWRMLQQAPRAYRAG